MILGFSFLGTLSWVLTGTILVLLGLVIRASSIGLTGSPDILSLISPVTANVFSITIGYTVAALIQRWFAIVVAVAASIALYAIDLMPGGLGWISAASPYHSFSPVAGALPNTQAFLGQIAVTLALILVLATTATIRLTRENGVRALTPISIAVALALFGGGIVYSQGGSNAVLLPDAEQSLDRS